MTDIELMQLIYPEVSENADGYFYGPYDYEPMVESFGKILVETHVNDYQGDSWYLLKKDDLYGYLSFGWGSCSGCDALQRCSSLEEVAELYNQLKNSITWRAKEETAKWFAEHDWEGDYCYYEEEFKEFLEKVDNYFLLFGKTND